MPDIAVHLRGEVSVRAIGLAGRLQGGTPDSAVHLRAATNVQVEIGVKAIRLTPQCTTS